MLAFMLLVSQQQAFAHLLNHRLSGNTSLQSVPSVQAERSKPGAVKLLLDQSCQECLSFVHFGSALPTHTPDFCAFAHISACSNHLVLDFLSGESPSPFLSRGPPANSFNLC